MPGGGSSLGRVGRVRPDLGGGTYGYQITPAERGRRPPERVGSRRGGVGAGPYSPRYRFKMIDAVVPPKPKELLMPYSRSTLRGVWGTKSRSHPSPGSSRLMV